MMVSYTEHLPIHQSPTIVLMGEKALPTATFIHEKQVRALFTTCSSDRCMLQAGNKSKKSVQSSSLSKHTDTGQSVCVWPIGCMQYIPKTHPTKTSLFYFVQAAVVCSLHFFLYLYKIKKIK